MFILDTLKFLLYSFYCYLLGTVLTESRRKEIYQLAAEHDMLILEDDPYYYLQFLPGDRPPSFLSLDTDGRVLRFDSFSKVLSSGLRLGFVSGPQQLVERIQLHMQCSVLHASSMSQVVAHQLLNVSKYFGVHHEYKNSSNERIIRFFFKKN